MHRPIVLAALLRAVLAASAVAGPRVTIYTHDLAYVQEPRTLSLGGNRDTLRIGDIPDRIDFPSVRLDAGERARVERLAYRYDLASGDNLLERSLGRRVRIVSQHGDRVSEGVLAASDGSWLVLRLDDGSVVNVARGDVAEVRLADAGKGMSLKPTLEVVLQSDRKGETPATLSFLTGGLSWSAEHRLTRTGETAGRWSTTVTVENTSGRDYRDATLRLVAGEPRRTAGSPEPRPQLVKTFMVASGAERKADLSEEAFSEYHLYTLDRPALLRDRESQSLVMLTERSVKLEPRYLVRQGIPGAVAQLLVVNDEASGLGVPLPGGRVRVFEPDGSGGEAFTGESTIGHTATAETLTVDVGTAFDIAVQRRQLYNKRISDREREIQSEIRLRNHKKNAVKIRVEENVQGDFDVLDETFKSARKDANTLSWEIPVAAGAEQILRYTVRVRY